MINFVLALFIRGDPVAWRFRRRHKLKSNAHPR